MRTEFPYLLAGTVAVAGGAAKEHKWPKNGVKAVAATAVLMLIASFFVDTPLEGYVRGLGWLLVLGSVYVSVPALNAKA